MFLDFLQIASGISSGSGLGMFMGSPNEKTKDNSHHLGSEILDSASDEIRIDKSNILLLGPTGSG